MQQIPQAEVQTSREKTLQGRDAVTANGQPLSLANNRATTKGLAVNKANRRPWLFCLGIAFCCLHMIISMPEAYSYTFDAVGLVMMFGSALFQKRSQMRFDLIAGLLMARVVWLVGVNVAHGAQASMFLNNAFFAAVAAVFVYVAASSIDFTCFVEKVVYGGMGIIVFAITLQIVGCYVEIGSFANFSTNKYLVSIPYGDSNSIAMGLIAMCIFLLLMSNSTKSKVTWCTVAFVGMVLLSSSGCMLSIALMLIALTVIKTTKFIRSKADARILAGVFVILAFVIMIMMLGAFSAILTAFSGTIEKIVEFMSGDLAAATTGRTTIYLHYLDLFYDSPLVGYGTIPAAGYYGVLESYRAHNLVLEALYHGGLTNLVLYVSACVVAFKGTRKDAFSLSVVVAVAFLLLNSMFEPGVFGFNKDFFMWLLLGLAQRREGLNEPA